MWLSSVGGIVTLVLSILATSLAAAGPPSAHVPRIGLLDTGSPSTSQSRIDAFHQGFRDLGYLEGQNMVLEYRWAEGNLDRLPDLATELVRLRVDVIMAPGTAAIRAAQHATRTIPIVMVGTMDPVAEGFVASLAHPDGNITGVSTLGTGLTGKRLEILKEMVPQRARIAVLTNPAAPAHGPWMHNLTVTAQALGLQLHVMELRRPEELDDAFTEMTRAGADALIVLEDALLLRSLRGRTVELAATHRLPAMYHWRELVVAGGLMSYGPHLATIYRRATVYVDKILKGAKPAELPVEQPMKFELVINLKTAKALGITIPPTLLFQADEVIR
jgi:putative ABC transport system substrate-binding protein